MKTPGEAILPGLAWVDIGRIDTMSMAQTTQRQGNKLRSIVHAKRGRDTALLY